MLSGIYELNRVNKPMPNHLKAKASQDINWFIISRGKIVNIKWAHTKSVDSVFTQKTKNGLYVHLIYYGIKRAEIVFKKWLEPNENDQRYS
jgi:hypothetical protein